MNLKAYVAQHGRQFGTLFGLVLLLVATIVNIIARLLVWSISRGPGDVRA